MRKYASFFEWFDKPIKEVGVVQELLISLNNELDLGLHSLQSFEPDPPDCVCLNADNNLVAIEVVEVVCQEAAKLNAQGQDVFRLWKPGDLSAHIDKLLAVKDKKTFFGGPYAEMIVCLFTDEPMLTFIEARNELKFMRFGPYEQLSSAFLLFSYDPASQSYPVLKLNINA